MIKLNTILFATDFSAYADQARAYACEFADRFDADLHILHVIHDPAVNVPDFGMGLAFPGFIDNLGELRTASEQQAISLLSQQLDPQWQQHRRVTLGTRFGVPFLEIIRYAREHYADLIVLAAHGRSGLSHMLMGSVAEKVVRKAPCPVLTVRPRELAEEAELQPGAVQAQPAPAE